MSHTYTRTHVKIGFANPFLICGTCSKPVPYWHDPDRCGCDGQAFNYPCEHKTEVISRCPSWSPVDGCNCDKPCSK